jgi:gas vesicle protein
LLRPDTYATLDLDLEVAMSDNAGSKVSFFIVGLGVGALLGILFAPKSGDETRDYLSSKADEGREYAQKKARELRERADDLLTRGKEAVSKQKDALASAVDAGKETYKRESKIS